MKYLKYFLITVAVLGIAVYVLLKVYNVNPPNLFSNPHKGSLPLDKLKLPPGFAIDIFAENVKNARSMSLSPSGTLFVSTRSAGNVYALQDTDGDNRVDKQYTILSEGNMPNGVAFKDGHLYVAEVNRILKFENIESKLTNPGKPIVVYDQYPTETHHGWKYIAFGPDGKLYVPVGAPCNICESKDSIYASITRINPDGTGREIVHSGIRNTVGFTWHPTSGEMWFTDNGRDMMGDDVPECELNHATAPHQHFGYPYCHQGDVADPEFGKKRNCSEFVPPVAKLGPHAAPLGLSFYTGSQFPAQYKNQLLITRHGSWNRTKKSGYDVMLANMDDKGMVSSVTSFITGWLDEAKDDVWGRPVDIEMMPDGSVLISDDFADVIYRVYYKG